MTTAKVHPLDDLTVLDQFKAAPFPPGYPATHRLFYSPVDDVHGCLGYVIQQAQKSLVIAMFGFDDPALAAIVKTKMEDPTIFVQLTLDSSQAAGAHEKEILSQENYPATSVAIGKSEKGAIMHLKQFIVDGVIVGTGSTNWSGSGEEKQDNQLAITMDGYIAAEARARIDTIHQTMKNQQAA